MDCISDIWERPLHRHIHVFVDLPSGASSFPLYANLRSYLRRATFISARSFSSFDTFDLVASPPPLSATHASPIFVADTMRFYFRSRFIRIAVQNTSCGNA